MNKNYRYNRSTKNFQGGGSKTSRNVAAGVMAGLGAIGSAINRASDASRVRRATKAAAAGNTKRADRIAGKLSGQAYSDYMMSKKPNPAGPMAEEKRGGSVKRRK